MCVLTASLQIRFPPPVGLVVFKTKKEVVDEYITRIKQSAGIR